jgi:tripartite-type tricarboxylate transporter receptor subunit TctC
MAAVLSSPPDGYTIGFVAPNNAINATLYDKLPFDFARDSVPVAGTMLLTNVMVVHPDVPAKTVAEFIAYAKANPGKINMASGGSGTSVHMSGELFKVMTGITMQHVPYRGLSTALVHA